MGAMGYEADNSILFNRVIATTEYPFGAYVENYWLGKYGSNNIYAENTKLQTTT